MATTDRETFPKSGETSSNTVALGTHRRAAGHLVLKPEARLSVVAAIIVFSFGACFVVGVSVGTLLLLVCLSGADHFFGLLADAPDTADTASEGAQATASFVVSPQSSAVSSTVVVQDSWLPMSTHPTPG